MSVRQRESIYDRLRPHLDAADLIARLGIKQSRVSGSEAYCDPLCHESSSGESLQINLQTGRWNCKGCLDIRGDLFGLVEYVLSGGEPPAQSTMRGSSNEHMAAVTWLCDQFGIAFDRDQVTDDPGLGVIHMFSMAAHEHLLNNPKMLTWIHEKWGFDRETVESYGIGFMPSPLLPEIVKEARSSQAKKAFKSSGLGWYSNDGVWHTRFEGRILFPYLEHGRSVYLIGRKTEATPMLSNGAQPPKYHKLSVHSETRPYISQSITNDHLYNETVMLGCDEVGILEGVADEVAISSLGVAAVSPVTISFNNVDQERFIRKCHENGITRVWILFDNELSGSGNWAARRVGMKLIEGGLAVKILTLPLGEKQQSHRDEVMKVLGDEVFAQLERLDPRKRKQLITETLPDENQRKWVTLQIAQSKIDAAEWCRKEGAGAAGKFNAIRANGQDVIHLAAADIAKHLDANESSTMRAMAFADLIDLVAYIDDALARGEYAAHIAKAAGKGVPKVEIAKRIAASRKKVVKPKRKDQESKAQLADVALQEPLIPLPPESAHSQPEAPKAPTGPVDPTVPKAPPAPGAKKLSPHERYSVSRDLVSIQVEAKQSEEEVGDYIAGTIIRSMGYTAFKTPEGVYLIRGNKRISVGTGKSHPMFIELLWLASGLTQEKSNHRAYIAAVIYFLGKDAKQAEDVSWSYVTAEDAIYFPQGDQAGHILKIEAGELTRTTMAEARVPAVAGSEFLPFIYTEDPDGIESILNIFRWTSMSEGDKLLLIYWIVCLPMLRFVGTVPIVRIEGGSGSGKTRAVDAVSYLVNGRRSSSVPTSAALVSRMSTEMLTIDDNRETADVSSTFLGTLLQATHLGAREKRKGNSDTGTVIERICGALLMNGIEPIHNGKSELASRMLTLHTAREMRAPDSPQANSKIAKAILEFRDRFWSESTRRCAAAMELDKVYGEALGSQIETIFDSTRIGRLSSYLRVMYLAWVAGLPEAERPQALHVVDQKWVDAFASIAQSSMRSLLGEELTVTVMRYVFAHGIALAEPRYQGSSECIAFRGKFLFDKDSGECYAGPFTAPQLARLARAAGKEMNAPAAITYDLRSGQLERRIIDGIEYLKEAGFIVQTEVTGKGKHRFTIHRQDTPAKQEPGHKQDGDTWTMP